MPNKLLVIGSYPKKEDRSIKNINAVASYNDHLLSEMSKRQNFDLIVLAEKFPDSENEYLDGAIKVIRCWEKGNSLYPFSIAREALKSRCSDILIQFEFNMFGGLFQTGIFPLLVVFLRLMGKRITIMFHQVIFDLSRLHGHLGISKKSFKTSLLNTIIKCFYYFTLKIANDSIVHEEYLRQEIIKTLGLNVKVVPHGLGEYDNSIVEGAKLPEYLETIPKDAFVLTLFGFFTWYKGTDFIVDAFIEGGFSNYTESIASSHVILLLAGDRSANLRDDPHYKDYYETLLQKIKSHPNIIMSGFVPDQDVPAIFNRTDLAVFPYRVQMSASGPMAVCFSFGKPLIISDELSGIFLNQDIKECLVSAGITSNDITFELTNKSLFTAINKQVCDKDFQNKVSGFSKNVSNSRKWSIIVDKYLQVIYERS